MPFAKGTPRPPGSGRQPGQPNHITRSIRDAIKEAFERRGGVDGLLTWAESNPDAFYALVGKLVPAEIVASVDVRNFVVEIPVIAKNAKEWEDK